MKQTYSGGCHCGAVRYQATIDLNAGTVRCNCSICAKSRAWLVAVPADDFALINGADAVTDYQFGTAGIHHLFCKHCGIKSFGRVGSGDKTEFVAVVVSTIEGIADAALAEAPITYLDGRNDDFTKAPQETRHL
jgi:hypothetical protein